MICFVERRHGVGCLLAVVLLVLVQSEIFLQSSVKLTGGSRPSEFIDLAPLPLVAGGTVAAGSDENWEDADMRRVPTGANPLHNR